MTKHTHTPGPWFARGDQVCAHRPHVCGGYNEESVLALSRLPAERQANARLISAAPEMLAALEMALAHMIVAHRTIHGIVPSVPDDIVHSTAIDAARAALAKARGT